MTKLKVSEVNEMGRNIHSDRMTYILNTMALSGVGEDGEFSSEFIAEIIEEEAPQATEEAGTLIIISAPEILQLNDMPVYGKEQAKEEPVVHEQE